MRFLENPLLRIVMFIIVVIIVAFYIHTYPLPSRPNVLGKEAPSKKTTPTPTPNFFKKTLRNSEQIFVNGVNSASDLVVRETQQVANLATSSLISNTASSVATQIQKLPPDQQQELKQQICK